MDTELARTIARAARSARTARGMRQADAAEVIGVSLEFYGRIERGGTLPSTPTLRSMAQALGVSADPLLGLTTKTGAPGGQPAPTAVRDTAPALRRLLRRLRKATPRTLRLLAAVAAALEARPVARVKSAGKRRR